MFFFSHDPAPSEIDTLSLHDALPISGRSVDEQVRDPGGQDDRLRLVVVVVRDEVDGVLIDVGQQLVSEDRKSTRLNSSHRCISYAVFCLKKKKEKRAKRDMYGSNTSA